MVLWKKELLRLEVEAQIRQIAILKTMNTQAAWNIVFKQHLAEWILPYSLVKYLKYNPRHLPVVTNRETTNEAHYLFLSIRRILHGYRTHNGGSTFPRSPFIS